MKQLKAFTPFKIDGTLYGWMTTASKPANAEAVAEKLDHLISRDPVGASWGSIGLVPPIDNLVHDLDGIARMVMVQINERILPGAVMREKLSAKVQDLQERKGLPVTKQEYAQLKDDVEIDLLPKSHIRRTLVPVMVFPDTLMIFTASPKKCDDVLALLMRLAAVKNTVKFEPQHIVTVLSHHYVFRQLAIGEQPDNDEHDAYVEPTRSIKFVGADKRSIVFKDSDVGGDEVQELLKDETLLVSELGLSLWDAEVEGAALTFTMSDRGVYKAVKLSGVLVSNRLGANKDDAHATAWLHARECKQLLDVMVDCHGGLDTGDLKDDDDDEL